jgi:cytochrome b subunit of formate dehydrogenase
MMRSSALVIDRLFFSQPKCVGEYNLKKSLTLSLLTNISTVAGLTGLTVFRSLYAADDYLEQVELSGVAQERERSIIGVHCTQMLYLGEGMKVRISLKVGQLGKVQLKMDVILECFFASRA